MNQRSLNNVAPSHPSSSTSTPPSSPSPTAISTPPSYVARLSTSSVSSAPLPSAERPSTADMPTTSVVCHPAVVPTDPPSNSCSTPEDASAPSLLTATADLPAPPSAASPSATTAPAASSLFPSRRRSGALASPASRPSGKPPVEPALVSTTGATCGKPEAAAEARLGGGARTTTSPAPSGSSPLFRRRVCPETASPNTAPLVSHEGSLPSSLVADGEAADKNKSAGAALPVRATSPLGRRPSQPATNATTLDDTTRARQRGDTTGPKVHQPNSAPEAPRHGVSGGSPVASRNSKTHTTGNSLHHTSPEANGYCVASPSLPEAHRPKRPDVDRPGRRTTAGPSIASLTPPRSPPASLPNRSHVAGSQVAAVGKRVGTAPLVNGGHRCSGQRSSGSAEKKNSSGKQPTNGGRQGGGRGGHGGRAGEESMEYRRPDYHRIGDNDASAALFTLAQVRVEACQRCRVCGACHDAKGRSPYVYPAQWGHRAQ